ncbi:MAG: tartrate dehydrogenase [Caldilineae bacterium]|nr:MAG: tartrate dehydrogenase [Caldilineae bacterium]
MKTYEIAAIPGDGIGKEILPEAVRLLEETARLDGDFRLEFTSFPWGSDYYLAHGCMMPAEGLERLREFDAILFGAVGWPQVPDSVSLWGLRLAICQGFDQYVNLRPARLLPGIRSPLRDKTPADIDFVVVRENTEGEYTGSGGRGHRGLPGEVAIESALFTRAGVERIIRYAFELARRRPAHRLACVTKSNAQKYGFALWDEVCSQVAEEFPEVTVERVLVDAMAARMVLHPETLDVVVASNLHGDILTDLAAAICGSLGVAPSGNIRPDRALPSMFEPIHGSAPDIAGRGIANPIGMFLSAALMLEFLGETRGADRIRSAVERTTAAGQVLTPDLGGNARTVDVTNAVIAALSD